ncbi:putative quinol monooxygenase [Stackebrandtia soli]|uniref:putative quinol monooxygenase n=1 Tax=Stackebrandtia soli TaxID=1892856 RepID=UPI0039EAB186
MVHVTVRARRDRRDEAIAALRRMQESTRRFDAGCLGYAFSVDLDDDCVFRCVETWRDIAALRAHLHADHMREPDAVLEETTTGPAAITVFDATAIDDWRAAVAADLSPIGRAPIPGTVWCRP